MKMLNNNYNNFMKKFEYKTLAVPAKGWMKYKQDFEALGVQLKIR